MGYISPESVKELQLLSSLGGKKVTLKQVPVEYQFATSRFTLGRQYSVQSVEDFEVVILDNFGQRVKLPYELFSLDYHKEEEKIN